jgi:uncharacterized membrane protein YcaP (DUF421 family)
MIMSLRNVPFKVVCYLRLKYKVRIKKGWRLSMTTKDFKLTDIQRILFGEAPPEFMLEVFIRTIITYIALLLALKLLGKRMTGQLSVTEMAVMITLGAIVSVPMQIPERGIVQGFLILLLAVGFQRGLNYLSLKNRRIENVTQGTTNILIEDGIMKLDTLNSCKITRQQLFSVLRNKEIFNLGKVKRAYLEACGLFSIYKYAENRPGLPLYPQQEETVQAEEGTNLFACTHCGAVTKKDKGQCDHCGNNTFIKATL